VSARVRPLTGGEIEAAIDDLARLRIEVFAAYPYLYDGDVSYEAEYLREFAAARDAVLVAAFDGTRIIGAATASPMDANKPEFRAPFEERGIDTARLFYFGESVLLPSYRGQGIGHAFFDHREAHARACGAAATHFAALQSFDDGTIEVLQVFLILDANSGSSTCTHHSPACYKFCERNVRLRFSSNTQGLNTNPDTRSQQQEPPSTTK